MHTAVLNATSMNKCGIKRWRRQKKEIAGIEHRAEREVQHEHRPMGKHVTAEQHGLQQPGARAGSALELDVQLHDGPGSEQ